MIDEHDSSDGTNGKSEEGLYLSRFFHELDRKKINYCVLRNYETLPDSIPGSDVDLLVSREDRPALIDVIEKIAVQSGWRIDSRYKKNYRIDHIRLCHAGNSSPDIIRFDVMTDIGLGFIRALEGKPILSKRQKQGHLYRVDEESETLINTLNALYARKRLKTKYLQQARAILSAENNLEKRLSNIIGRTNAGDVTTSIINNEIIFRPDRFTWMLVRNNRWRIAGMAADVLYNLANRVLRYIHPPGRMIAILGPDGVGKSTVAEKVADSLSAAFSDTRVFHLRPMMTPPLSRFIKGRRSTSTVTTVGIRARKPAAFPSLIRVLYYGFDYVFGYWFKIRPLLARGSLIVFDRYFFDYFVDKDQKAVKLPVLLLRGLFVLFPKPALTIVLDADPALVHERRSDLSISEIERQNTGYTRLANQYKRFTTVNANHDIVTIASQIEAKIFSNT